MAEHEQEFVEYVVKALVEKPDAVSVKRSLDEKGVFLELTVDPDDVGKVIGKKGSTINALRALLRVLGAKYDARYSLKVIEPEGSMHESRNSGSESTPEVAADQPAEAHEEVAAEPENTEVDDIKARAKEGLEDFDDFTV